MRYSDDEFRLVIEQSSTLVEALSKLGLQAAGANYRTLYSECKRLNISIEKFSGNRSNYSAYRNKVITKENRIIPLELILTENSSYTSFKLKKRLLKEKYFEHKCYKCGLHKWNDQDIPLELDHINGDTYDNRITNLTLLCPNCHAQTPTYRGKNKQYRVKREKPEPISKTFYKDKPKSECSTIHRDKAKLDFNPVEIQHRLQTVSIVKLANDLGISPRRLNTFLKKNGIKSPRKNSKKFEISKEILEKLIQTKSFLEIGKLLGVSDNAIKKRCIQLGIDISCRKRLKHGKYSKYGPIVKD